jgi:hypothetical protein
VVCCLASSFSDKHQFCIILDESSFIHIFQHQISDLVVIIGYGCNAQLLCSLYACIVNICIKFTNLTHLHLDMNEKCFFPYESHDLSSITGHSFNIVYLNITVKSFDDCLFLLNDHLSQLRTFIVYIKVIGKTSTMIQNTVRYLTKQCYESGQNRNRVKMTVHNCSNYFLNE